jgi:DMSO/TMAO reductase YedYZ heme-binding membrane subunit
MRRVISPAVRRGVLALHVTCSVGWVGVVVAYIGLGVAAERGGADTVRGAWIAMEILGWYVLAPLAVGSWSTGIFLALGTKWGLLRHYWVASSLVLTTLGLCLIAVHMPRVSAIADTVRAADPPTNDYGGDLMHSVLALAVLVAIQYLNIYKPQGMTPYGARKMEEATAPPTAPGASPEPAPTSTPRRSR